MVQLDVLVLLFATAISVVHARGVGHATTRRAQHRSHARAHARLPMELSPRAPKQNSTYSLVDLYQGTTFFDGFDFFSKSDPTHGMVNYQTESNAKSKGLAYVQEDGVAVVAVDDYTPLPVGTNRNSVRIESKKTYNRGLIVADFYKMPHGCSVWPAWWTVGPNWPLGGEIDILEGSHDQPTNQYTLHTGGNCVLDTKKHDGSKLLFTSNIGNTKCASSGGNNIGCVLNESDTRSYGGGFNNVSGGAYAMQWDSTGIKTWFFSRSELPADLATRSNTPDPSSWGTPAAFFSSDTCDTASHFHDHKLVLDTTLCGDLAGSNYGSVGYCPGTCAERVAVASNFKFAKWKVNYIAVYDK